MLYTEKENIQYEIRSQKVLNEDTIGSTFIYLKKLLSEGVTTGDDNIDALIMLQAKMYEDKGIKMNNTAYSVKGIVVNPQVKKEEYVTEQWLTNYLNEMGKIFGDHTKK